MIRETGSNKDLIKQSIKKLGEVCIYSKGKKPANLRKEKSKETSIPYINIKAFEKSVFDEYTDGVKCNLCNDGDLLMVWDGARCGLVGKAKKGAVGSTLMKIEPKPEINKEFLFYFLLSKFNTLNTKSKGVGIPHIEPTLLWNFELVLPSLIEQLSIVSKIEELFSELDNGITHLKTSQLQLKVYRQSLLKAAFEGRLTNKNVKDGNLPEGWAKKKICLVASVNPKLPNKEKIASNLEVQFLPMKLVHEVVDKVDLLETRKFSEVQNGSYTPFKNDDVIFAKVTPCMENGKIAVVKNLKNGIGYGSSEFHVIRCGSELINKYLFYFLVQDRFREYAANAMTGAVGLRRVPKQFLENYEIPIPPISEQQLIIEELERKIDVCNNIEETLNNRLLQAETLRQSILKKAFEGRLVQIVRKNQEAKIVPSHKPQNEYFYQVQILALISKVSKQNGIEHGEMTLAKYAYIADKIYKIPTYYDFQRWHLGPYPLEIKKAVSNKKFFKKVNNHIELVDEENLLKYDNFYVEHIKSAINELASIFSMYKTKDRGRQTELLATVCKVVEDIQLTDLKSVRNSMAEWKIELKGEKYKTKAEKFSEVETKSCLQFLKEKGWDKKLLKL